MSKDGIPMFKDGDKAMLVIYPQWVGARSFRTVEIGKVHKTGRLTLKGSRDQWSFSRGFLGDADHFATRHDRGLLLPWSDELALEINVEIQMQINCRKLNKIGDALSRVRDLEQSAKIRAVMPPELKALISEASQ